LVILGDGPGRASLEALAGEMGLGDRVAMPGYVAHIGPWLRQARLFALCSRYEGLPAMVLEVMAAGCPVVSTRCFLSADNLMDDATPAAFARAMDRCWSAPRSPALPEIASRFSIADGVRSHVGAVRALLDRTAFGDHRPCSDGSDVAAGSPCGVKES
jgi:glycosyltransferase involved in cell wall biosynthesis